MSHLKQRKTALRTLHTPISRAIALGAVAAVSWGGPAAAAIISTGQVSPDPSSGLVSGWLLVGSQNPGSVTVNSGSALTTDGLGMASSTGGVTTGNGSFTVTGVGSSTTVTRANGTNLDIGGQGTGSLTVMGGASFSYGAGDPNCAANCRTFISNAAGSTGSLVVSGTGSSFSTLGSVTVGQATVFRLANGDTLDYGVVGGHSDGSAQVLAGAAATSSQLTVGAPGGGTTARNGSESSTGSLLIDGMNSMWNLVRTAVQNGSRALLNLAIGQNTTGSATVSNGGTVRIDGSVASGEYTGVNIASPAATSTASNVVGNLTVTGTGSRVEFVGGRGFFNVGRSAGASAQLTVANGGVITGVGGETGLNYMNIGQGGTGTATVTGAGSLLRLNGRNSSTNTFAGAVLGGGAFLNVGRLESIAGNGTLNVNQGGQVVIDTSAVALTNTAGRTGFGIGWEGGSSGTVNVSGAGSALQVTAGSGLAPYVAIGRDSGSGTLNITNGGQVEVTSTHTSVPGATYANGDFTQFEIGRRTNAGTEVSSGTVTVNGTGSLLSLGGTADSLLFVGRGNNANGALNISSGGTVSTRALLVGQDSGSSGMVNMNGGHLLLGGTLTGGPSAGQTGGLSIGRGGGVGTVNVGNGSTIQIAGTAPRAALLIGGNSVSPGGTGTLNVSGGSTITVNSPDALVTVGGASSSTAMGIGTLNLSGAGSSVSALGSNARVLIGAAAGTAGTAVIGAGASLNAAGLIGVAHDGTANTGGTGTLIVNGTATAPSLVVGSAGLLGGSGVINGDVTNHGVINPGNSPGRLTINGSLDNTGGHIVLEVKYLGSGHYAYDEIVVSDWAHSTLGAGEIEFNFLDATDPTAFLATGNFNLGTFFRQDLGGGVLGALDDAYVSLFKDVSFSGSSTQYNIGGISFGPTGAGGLTVAAVPVTDTLALGLLALGMMGLMRRRPSRSGP